MSVETLRHYDRLKLLKPVHLDRFTGYRYYSLDQLPRLNRILAAGRSQPAPPARTEPPVPAPQVQAGRAAAQAQGGELHLPNYEAATPAASFFTPRVSRRQGEQ